MRYLLLLALAFPLWSTAQSKKERKAMEARLQADRELRQRLEAHVQYLASDSLQGRKTGTPGEALAYQYITQQFAAIGLKPLGEQGYLQKFTISEGKIIDKNTRLVFNDDVLKPGIDYFPLACSPNSKASGFPAIALKESGMPWFVDLKDWLENNKNNPPHNLQQYLRDQVKRAAGKGATAVIFYNSGPVADGLTFDSRDSSQLLDLPAVYIEAPTYKKYCSDKTAFVDVDMEVAIAYNNLAGYNVAGIIDNGAPATVVLGAHYDHIGIDPGANNTTQVYNGADDNASGIAALLEVARLLKTSGNNRNNYVFVAFSGREMNMTGSRHWIKNAGVPGSINYMINLDMVGRYDENRRLTVGGYSTSPAWQTVFDALPNPGLAVNLGPLPGEVGDHTVFYDKSIPILHFFTGSHADYQKPTDDWDKVNYDGEVKIVRYVHQVVDLADRQGVFTFSKPVETVTQPRPFTVSLGVVPDASWTGKGYKIGGVTPRRLAEKIGLKPGDILLKLGDYEIDEMNSYMQALSMFKKGDVTTLTILRDSSEKSMPVEFQ